MFVQKVNQLPAKVRNLTWEIRSQLGKSLNKHKDPINNDYRLVASRLNLFGAEDIEALSQSPNPTMEMLKHCNNTTTMQLFKIILDIERKDVLEDLLKYLSGISNNHCGLPTQVSLDDDEKSTLSQPLEESCTARYLYLMDVCLFEVHAQ